MRRLIPLSTLLACGPLAPSADITSTTDETTTTTTTATTNPLPDPTTTIAATTTTTASTTDPTSSGTTLADVGTIDCDLYAQDCPPGQKCVAGAEDGGGAWDATRCVDIIGDAAPGEPCTTMGSGPSFIDDCALGAICWDVDETHHGTCIALCAGSWDAPICPPQSICSGGELLNLCIPTCHPLLQDCPGDDLCIPNLDGTSFTCVLDASRDEGQANDPTEFVVRFSRILDASARWRSSNPVRSAARGTRTYRGYQTSPAVVNPISIGYRGRTCSTAPWVGTTPRGSSGGRVCPPGSPRIGFPRCEANVFKGHGGRWSPLEGGRSRYAAPCGAIPAAVGVAVSRQNRRIWRNWALFKRRPMGVT